MRHRNLALISFCILGACNMTPEQTGECRLSGTNEVYSAKMVTNERGDLDHWEYKDSNQFTRKIDDETSDDYQCTLNKTNRTPLPKR